MVKINIANDFSRYPSGRYQKNGTTSGEEFRLKFLTPLILSGEKIQVQLDGTIGYGSSFLEEAFGGLVRQTKMPGTEILNRIEFQSEDETLVEEIKEYIIQAVAE